MIAPRLSSPARLAILVAGCLASAVAMPQELPKPAPLGANQISRITPGANADASAHPPADSVEPRGADGRINPLWSTPLAAMTATRERPIFSPTRRPPPAIVPVSFQPQPPIDQPGRPLLALVGAIAGETDGFAIFLDETTRAIVRLKTGESHSGWTLRSVQARQATLQRGPQTITLAIPTAN